MKTESIPKTLSPLEDTCPKCDGRMSAVNFEHFTERSCTCGYTCRDLSGETKLRYSEAVGSFTLVRSVR